MAVLCVFMMIACGYDYLQKRIPNKLLILLLFMGVGWQMREGSRGVLLFLAGAMTMITVMYPFFKLGCIGAGDVKLLGLCAGYLPIHKIFYFLFFSLLTAAIFSLIKMIKQHSAKERLFCLCAYLTQVWSLGKWQRYPENERKGRNAGICLSGPIFLSVLMYMGGVY